MEDRKVQIIKLSIELIKKYGYDSFSYADLSKTLGITKASIHHHFPKKDNLGLEICSYLQTHMLEEFATILSEHTSAKIKIKNYFNLYANIIKEGDKICPIASLEAEANIISKDMRTIITLIDDSENKFIVKILNMGIESGEFNIVGSVEAEAMLIASTLKGALQYARIHGKQYYNKITTQLIAHLLK